MPYLNFTEAYQFKTMSGEQIAARAETLKEFFREDAVTKEVFDYLLENDESVRSKQDILNRTDISRVSLNYLPTTLERIDDSDIESRWDAYIKSGMIEEQDGEYFVDKDLELIESVEKQIQYKRMSLAIDHLDIS